MPRKPKEYCTADGRDSFTACNHEFESGLTIYVTKGGVRMAKAGIRKSKFFRRPRDGWMVSPLSAIPAWLRK